MSNAIRDLPQEQGWTPVTSPVSAEAITRLYQSLADSAKEEQERPSGLPKDWHNRLIRV